MNIGDESYVLSLPMLFPQHKTTFTNTLDDTLVKDSDVIVLGGGNVLGGYFLDSLQKYKGKPIYAISVGVFDWKITADKLSLFKRIVVRDMNSYEFIKALGVKVEVAPDIAFLLNSNAENGKQILAKYFKQEGTEVLDKKVVVVINAYLPRNGQNQLGRDDFHFQTFSFDFAGALDKIKANFIFLPFGQKHPWDDRVSNGWVAMKCEYHHKNFVCYDRLSPQDALDVIAASNVTISTRLHSSIFSLMAGVPFVDIVHNDKNKFFLKGISVGEQLDYWNFGSVQFVETINKLLSADSTAYRMEAEKLKRSILSLPIITL